MRIFTALRRSIVGMTVALVQFGVANAGSISTPILFLSNNTNQVICVANNVSGGTVNVTVKILGLVSGSSIETCSLPVNDRGGCQGFLNGAGYCRIGISGLTNDQVREVVRGVMFTRSTAPPFALEAVVQAQ